MGGCDRRSAPRVRLSLIVAAVVYGEVFKLPGCNLHPARKKRLEEPDVMLVVCTYIIQTLLCFYIRAPSLQDPPPPPPEEKFLSPADNLKLGVGRVERKKRKRN